MKHLKEKNEKKNQKEIRKENPPPPHPRAREEGIDLNDIERVPTAYDRGITRWHLKQAADVIDMTADEVNEWQEYMVACDWRFASGAHVTSINFRRSLRMWHKMEDIIRAERFGQAPVEYRAAAAEKQLKNKVQGLMKIAKINPALWALCRERCENSDTCGCKCGVKIPPDRQVPRPHRPEECPHFKERNDVA